MSGARRPGVWDIGRITQPVLTASGKRINITQRPTKIKCSCTCRHHFSTCGDNSGSCDCAKIQVKINNNPSLLQADKMVNLYPTVNIVLNVRDPNGGYREYRTMHFDDTMTPEARMKRAELRRRKENHLQKICTR